MYLFYCLRAAVFTSYIFSLVPYCGYMCKRVIHKQLNACETCGKSLKDDELCENCP